MLYTRRFNVRMPYAWRGAIRLKMRAEYSGRSDKSHVDTLKFLKKPDSDRFEKVIHTCG